MITLNREFTAKFEKHMQLQIDPITGIVQNLIEEMKNKNIKIRRSEIIRCFNDRK